MHIALLLPSVYEKQELKLLPYLFLNLFIIVTLFVL